MVVAIWWVVGHVEVVGVVLSKWKKKKNISRAKKKKRKNLPRAQDADMSRAPTASPAVVMVAISWVIWHL